MTAAILAVLRHHDFAHCRLGAVPPTSRVSWRRLLLAGLLTLATCAITGLAINFANIIALAAPARRRRDIPDLFCDGVARRRRCAAGSPRAAACFTARSPPERPSAASRLEAYGTASLGILLTIALFYTLLATLIFLPALLVRTQNRHGLIFSLPFWRRRRACSCV